MTPLTLDPTDPSVMQAKASEAALFEHYGIKVRLTEFGSGDPVAIVPGNTGDAFPLAALLAGLRGKRIFAINRPGGGLSKGIDHRQIDVRQFAVETLFEALNLQQADVVAHSMGAHWATLFALARPDRVRRMALLGNPDTMIGVSRRLSSASWGPRLSAS